MSREVYATSKPLTRRQEVAVNAIARAALNKSGERGEFKEWEVGDLRPGVSNGWIVVRVISGMTNDDGTAAAIFCRYRGFFLVGPRGGIKPYTRSKHGTKSDAKKHPLIYGFES